MKTAYLCILFLVLGCLGTPRIQAQQTIQSDRPGQAFSSYALPTGSKQLQVGLYTDRLGTFSYSDPADVRYSDTGLETTLRLGVVKRVDLQVTLDGMLREGKRLSPSLSGTDPVETREPATMYLNPVVLGGRYHLSDQHGILPSTAVIVRWFSPLASEEVRAADGALEFRLATQHQFLQDRFSYSFNIAAVPLLRDPWYQWVHNLGYSVSKRVGIFVEYFADYQLNVTNHQYDGGFSFLLSDNTQLDAFAGVRQWENEFYRVFGSVGFSTRF